MVLIIDAVIGADLHPNHLSTRGIVIMANKRIPSNESWILGEAHLSSLALARKYSSGAQLLSVV